MTNVLILGDFNVDFLSNPTKHLIDILNLHSLKQVIHILIRITDTSRTCLDLIITQSPDIIKSSDVLSPFCSDRSVPCVVLKPLVYKQGSFKRTIYNYTKSDSAKCCELLGNEYWNSIFDNGSLDRACELFTDGFMSIAKQCMPFKIVTVRPNDAPWFNNELKRLIKR